MSSIGLYEGPEYYKKKIPGPAERLEQDLYNIIEDMLAIGQIDLALHALGQGCEMAEHAVKTKYHEKDPT